MRQPFLLKTILERSLVLDRLMFIIVFFSNKNHEIVSLVVDLDLLNFLRNMERTRLWFILSRYGLCTNPYTYFISPYRNAKESYGFFITTVGKIRPPR